MCGTVAREWDPDGELRSSARDDAAGTRASPRRDRHGTTGCDRLEKLAGLGTRPRAWPARTSRIPSPPRECSVAPRIRKRCRFVYGRVSGNRGGDARIGIPKTDEPRRAEGPGLLLCRASARWSTPRRTVSRPRPRNSRTQPPRANYQWGRGCPYGARVAPQLSGGHSSSSPRASLRLRSVEADQHHGERGLAVFPPGETPLLSPNLVRVRPASPGSVPSARAGAWRLP
jgi:hypothetical protein